MFSYPKCHYSSKSRRNIWDEILLTKGGGGSQVALRVWKNARTFHSEIIWANKFANLAKLTKIAKSIVFLFCADITLKAVVTKPVLGRHIP